MTQQGSGSIWNVNSWHWENKNYTPIVKKLLEEKIQSLEMRVDDLELQVEKVDLTGEASVSIRKGRQILCFEFDATVEFSMEENKGSFKIRDINAQELDFEVYDIKMEEKGKVQDKIKEYLRLFLQKKLLAKFSDINEQIMKRESDPEKLKQDQIKRTQALEETIKVRELTGAEKEKMLLEQKEKDRLFKEQEQQKSQQN